MVLKALGLAINRRGDKNCLYSRENTAYWTLPKDLFFHLVLVFVTNIPNNIIMLGGLMFRVLISIFLIFSIIPVSIRKNPTITTGIEEIKILKKIIVLNIMILQ